MQEVHRHTCTQNMHPYKIKSNKSYIKKKAGVRQAKEMKKVKKS